MRARHIAGHHDRSVGRRERVGRVAEFGQGVRQVEVEVRGCHAVGGAEPFAADGSNLAGLAGPPQGVDQSPVGGRLCVPRRRRDGLAELNHGQVEPAVPGREYTENVCRPVLVLAAGPDVVGPRGDDRVRPPGFVAKEFAERPRPRGGEVPIRDPCRAPFLAVLQGLIAPVQIGEDELRPTALNV